MTKLKQHHEIIHKQEILLQAKTQLKREFIGIDTVIDQVIDLCSSWYLLPRLQDKPVVINLWGLTGVGKSSLVNRLAELLLFTDKYYRFDLGDKTEKNWSVKNQLEDIYENENGYPIMLAFDEFQHARSLDVTGVELDKQANRIIWELLDTGKFMVSRWQNRVDEIYQLIAKLNYALAKGIKINKGKVSERKNLFIEILKRGDESLDLDEDFKDENNIFFVPKKFYPNLFELNKENFDKPFEIEEQLLKLSGLQTIKYLKKMIDHAISPKLIDCSKAVIFVLGNLDEAYTMSNSYNPDMDADEFHIQSLKINISSIKHALRLRFRNEQIARLGNNHIIYPAFSKKTFKKIIQLELDKIVHKIKSEYQIGLIIDSTLEEIIYNEGVYPTQGTRPIFTTIHQMVNSKLGSIITKLYLENLNADKIKLSVKDNRIKIHYFQKGQIIYTDSYSLTLTLSKLRESKKDDMQAIAAVHESGHAILSIFLLHTIPEVIYSKTADALTEGFVYSDFKWNYISKKEILLRIAVFLGGIIAEKIIFGEENITNGSESDIEKATHFVTGMLKESGMGELPGNFQVADTNTNNHLFDLENKINKQAEILIIQAEKLAFKTLKDQEYLLIEIADYLSDNRVLHKLEIKDYLIKFGKDYDINNIIENGSQLFYRSHLKQKVNKLKLSENDLIISNGFSLNKESLK